MPAQQHSKTLRIVATKKLKKSYHFESVQNVSFFYNLKVMLICLFLIVFAAEAGVVLNLFSKNESRVLIKLFL